MITIDDVHKKDDGILVSLYIECDSTCDSTDRMNYALYLYATQGSAIFKAVNADSVVEVPRGLVIVNNADPIRVVDDRTNGKGGLSGGQIVMIVVSCVVFVLGVLFAGMWWMGRQGYASPMMAIRNMMNGNGDDGDFLEAKELA